MITHFYPKFSTQKPRTYFLVPVVPVFSSLVSHHFRRALPRWPRNAKSSRPVRGRTVAVTALVRAVNRANVDRATDWLGTNWSRSYLTCTSRKRACVRAPGDTKQFGVASPRWWSFHILGLFPVECVVLVVRASCGFEVERFCEKLRWSATWELLTSSYWSN